MARDQCCQCLIEDNGVVIGDSRREESVPLHSAGGEALHSSGTNCQ